MHLYRGIVDIFFLTCLFLITHITDIYLIYGIYACADTTSNFEKVVVRFFYNFTTCS